MDELFSHINLAHKYWKEVLKVGDLAIDATCGNGNDTLALAKCVLSEEQGKVISLDIQEIALENTKKLLEKHLSLEELEKVDLLSISHAHLDKLPLSQEVKLIVYNLGYLPKGDKSLTTQTETTLISVKQALEIISPKGFISITCYPGHSEGQIELNALFELLQNLPSHLWNVCYHNWVNKPKAPTLFFIQKK